MLLYKDNEYCLNFEKSEIEEYFLKPLISKFPQIVLPVWGKSGPIIIDKSKVESYFFETT